MLKMDVEHPEAEILPHTNTPKSFLSFLAEQQNGALVSELSDELREVTEAIESCFAKYRGKVTGELKLNIKFKLEGGHYKVDIEYTSKRPKAPVSSTIMWLGQNGDLQSNNPKQIAMSFTPRSVS